MEENHAPTAQASGKPDKPPRIPWNKMLCGVSGEVLASRDAPIQRWSPQCVNPMT